MSRGEGVGISGRGIVKFHEIKTKMIFVNMSTTITIRKLKAV